MGIKIFTTGGTIDKFYFDARSEYSVGEPQIATILESVRASVDYEIETVFRKDSLDITEEDRRTLVRKVRSDPSDRILITHGTDTIVETATALGGIPKTVVLVGSLSPARFRITDAEFNIGFAMAAVQLLSHGAYVAMNGLVFAHDHVRKPRDANRFELT